MLSNSVLNLSNYDYILIFQTVVIVKIHIISSQQHLSNLDLIHVTPFFFKGLESYGIVLKFELLNKQN